MLSDMYSVTQHENGELACDSPLPGWPGFEVHVLIIALSGTLLTGGKEWWLLSQPPMLGQISLLRKTSLLRYSMGSPVQYQW